MTSVVTPSTKAKKGTTSIAKFDRDMWRLKSLRDKYDNPGLNTIEGNEVKDILEEYDIEYTDWVRRDMFSS